MKLKRQWLAVAVLWLTAATSAAESVTYKITEYNTSTADFTLKASGKKPVGSYVVFLNDYGATTGNRYNQIPRNREASFLLEGWQGCTIKAVTLNMCSNAHSGQFALSVSDGETVLLNMPSADFSSAQWYGQWVSKDLGIYVDITTGVQTVAPVQTDEVVVKLKGGTAEGSVYVNSITIDYEPSSAGVESPLGWSYSRMAARATLSEGDVVMLYRNGDAAADIDGMETSHYLDAIGIASTSSVYEQDVELFTVSRSDDGNWTFTDQFGRKLGAKAAQNLAWNEGVTSWTVSIGYDGATIASTNTRYGTLRYNAPSGSYPRFWNYTSNSLSLPYLYKRGEQNTPVVSTSLLLSSSLREVSLEEQDTLVLKHTFYPTTTTDTRVSWSTSDEHVATVRDGIVTLVGQGTAVITAQSVDAGSNATCTVIVSGSSTGLSTIMENDVDYFFYNTGGQRVINKEKGVLIRNDGRKILHR